MNLLNRYKDAIAAMVFIILSAFLFYNTSSIRVFAPNSANYINARFFPYLLSSVLGVVSLGQLIMAICRQPAAEDGETGKSRAGMIRIILTLLLLVMYVGLMREMGFLIMTAVYIFFQVLILAPKERRSIPAALILAVVSSGVIYYVFTQILQMMLPRAPFMSF